MSEEACLVCKEEVVYKDKAEEMECIMCHKEFLSHASCGQGHYICDECHARKGIQVIMEGCLNTDSRNPILIMQELMEHPFIYMHGPEHHVLAGAALLAAYHNSGGELMRKEALHEMEDRGSQVPGGICGLWGCCGAGVSAGIFMSIITKSTPLTGKSWGLSNRTTSRALASIAELGGPRCCKRDSFTAVSKTVEVVKEALGIQMELPGRISCSFSDRNQQCLKKKCPYYLKDSLA